MSELLTTLYRPVGRRVRPDQGKPISRIPATTAGATDLLSSIVGVLCEADRTDRNTKDERSGFVGFALRFNVKASFLREYDVHIVGSSDHKEYWIPAADLARLNANIVGEIEVIAEFRGKTGKA